MGWIDSLPGALGAVSHPAVIVLASALTVIEFLATLIPGIASLWETIHTAIRPPAAAVLAVLTAWHGDPALIAAAALLGGGLGFATHATKLGLRYTIDASPEPITNGAANVAELGVVASIAYAIWHHPYPTLTIAIAVLVLLMLLVRTIWRAMRRALRGLKSPSASPG
jgi:type II secretory pathway component PulF